MKLYFTILLLGILASITSCEKKVQGPDCSRVLCAYTPPALRIKYLDKNTRKNLLFDINSKYSLNDLKITSTRLTNYPPVAKKDSTNNEIVIIENVGTGDLIQLGDLPADRIDISSKATSEECCSPVVITNLRINNKQICQPCTNLKERLITLEK